jgi:hypothetical protein
MAFERERFLTDCRAAVSIDATHRSASELVARAVSVPASVTANLGEPTRAGIETLYHAPDLTILNVV